MMRIDRKRTTVLAAVLIFVAHLTGVASLAARSADFDAVGSPSGTDANLSLTAALTMATQHVGQPGEVYVAAGFNGAVYFNNGRAWQTQIAPYFSGPLAASKSIAVVSGIDLSRMLGLEIYVGYGLNLTDMISASRYRKVYTVTGAGLGATAVPYAQGNLAGKDVFYTQLSDSFAATSGAVLQAILSVNSLVFTDKAVTNLETFKLRKAAADQALSILDTKAKATETIIAGSESGSFAAAYSPAEVLATVSSGPANQQLKTLMKNYQVSAAKAKVILEAAMAGLTSQYNQEEAVFYDTAARTATLVKEGAGLTFTMVGAVVSAGSATGVLPLADAAVTLITGTDGIVKVTKAGLELAKGADVQLPEGKVKGLLTVLSDTAEIISFTDLRKWGSVPERLSNVMYLTGKLNDAMQDGVLNLGDQSFDLKPIAKPLPPAVSNQLIAASGSIPSTMPGTYKISGSKVTVSQLPTSVSNVIAMLPETDRVPAPEPVTGTTTPPTRITLKFNGGASYYLNYVHKTNPTATNAKRILAEPLGCGGTADRVGVTASGRHKPVFSIPLQGQWSVTFSADSSRIVQLNCDVSWTSTEAGAPGNVRYTFVLTDIPFKEIYSESAFEVTRRYQPATGKCSHILSMSIVYPPVLQWWADYTFASQECPDAPGPQIDVTEYKLAPFPAITP